MLANILLTNFPPSSITPNPPSYETDPAKKRQTIIL
jgi:hypothetical protein